MKLRINEGVTNIPAKSKLNAVINKYFDGDADSYSRLPWTISHGGYDLEAEIYLDRTPVCDIIYTPYYYEIRNINSNLDIAPIVKDILDSMNIEAKVVS